MVPLMILYYRLHIERHEKLARQKDKAEIKY